MQCIIIIVGVVVVALYKSLSNCRNCCCCASILLLINVTTHFGPTGPQSLSTSLSLSAANGAADVAQSSLCGWLRAAAADSDAVRARGDGGHVCCLLFFCVCRRGINVSEKYKNGRHSKFSNR